MMALCELQTDCCIKILITANLTISESLALLPMLKFSDAGTGGTRGATAPPPIFGRSFFPIPTMGGKFCPPFTSGTSNVFHLPAPLQYQRDYPYPSCKTNPESTSALTLK